MAATTDSDERLHGNDFTTAAILSPSPSSGKIVAGKSPN
jgi:hypothetical protein